MGIKGKNCLIVDDDPAVRALARKVLEVSGFIVYEAEGVSEALRIIKEHVPHVLLLDLNMPDIDGFKFLRLREQNKVLMDIPVLVFSAESKEKIIVKAIAMGAEDFLTKPLNSKVMIQKLRRIFLTIKDKDKFVPIPDAPQGELIVDGEITRISSMELVFDSPVKLSPEGMIIKVDGEKLDVKGMQQIGCSVGSVRTNSQEKGRYITECKYVGLSSELKERISKKIRGWRCE